MNAWSGSTQFRLSQSTVLLIGTDSRIQRSLARELQALSATTVTAMDLDDASQIQWESRNRPAVMLIPENSVEPEDFEEQLAALPDQSRTLSLVNSPTSRRTSRAQGMANPDFLIREGKGSSMLQSVLERRLFRDATTVGCRLRHLPRTTLGPRTAAHRRSHPVYESRRRRTGSAPRHGH